MNQNHYPINMQHPPNYYPVTPYTIPKPIPVVIPPGFKKKENCNCGKKYY